MYHGLLFDTDGKVIKIPGQDLITCDARGKSYKVVERRSWIWVWMGEAQEADHALIPPVVGYDDPDYILGHGQLDYAAAKANQQHQGGSHSSASGMSPAAFTTASPRAKITKLI